MKALSTGKSLSSNLPTRVAAADAALDTIKYIKWWGKSVTFAVISSNQMYASNQLIEKVYHFQYLKFTHIMH